MKNQIIIAALTSFKERFWEGKNIEWHSEEIINTVKQVGLNNLDLRREAMWGFAIEIYKQLPKASNAEQLKGAMFNALCDKPYINEEVIEGLLKERYLHKDHNIETFHKLIENHFDEGEARRSRGDIIHFLVELVGYFEVTKGDSTWTMEAINKSIKGILGRNFKDIDNVNGLIRSAQNRRRVIKEKCLKEFAAKYSSSHEVFANCLSNLLGEQVEVKPEVLGTPKEQNLVSEEFSFEDGLANMLSEMGLGEEILQEAPKAADQIAEKQLSEVSAPKMMQGATQGVGEAAPESMPEVARKIEVAEVQNVGQAAVEENLEKQAEQKVDEKTQKALLRHLNEMASLLGYELHQKGDQVMSKEAYEILLAEKETAKVKIFKELAQLKNQAVLSELYNAYTNIKNVSYDNLEAILGNFFNMLAMQGVEIEEEGLEVGESITVETTQALKDFIFEQPTREQGQVKAKVLYKAWAYKGKTIMPKVVKVKEEA